MWTEFQWFPSFGDLPMEIILHIFRYLDHSDLQAAGTTCVRWREAMLDSEFSDKTMVHFANVCLSDSISPAKDFLKTGRLFRYFYLEDVTFGQVQDVMAHIGKSAIELTLDKADLGDKQFYTIMRQLPHLRRLTITRCSPLFMSGSFLESNNDRTGIDRTFASIKHLSLHDNQYLSDAILLRLTALIKGIETLDMSDCHIAYHNAIHRRFYPQTNDVSISGINTSISPSESILTFKFIQRVLTLHQPFLCELNLSGTFIGEPALLSLCEMKNGLNLLHLRLADCRQLNAVGLKTFLQTQPQLVSLDLSNTPCVNDDLLQSIVTATPLLEQLHIAGCARITNEGAVLIGTLKHLRRLNISRCSSIGSEGITRGIVRVKNFVLRELHMSHLKVCDECIKCVARNLPQLLILDVSYCVNAVCDDSVQCIIEHMRWLREFSLEDCYKVTDSAFTGINVTKLNIEHSIDNSLETFHPPPTCSLIERENLRDSIHSMKISLRSKAEEDIVRDAQRKKAMFAAYELNLIDVSDIEGYCIQQMRGLTSLNLKGCNRITDVSLRYGLKFVELRRLSLSNCQQISQMGMEALAQNCPSIEELDLSDCCNINDKSVQVLTNKLRRMRALHISGCTQLTDHSLDAILTNCKCLQTLSVYRCRHMYTDIESRLAELSTLRNLNMDNSSSMDTVEIFRLKKGLVDY